MPCPSTTTVISGIRPSVAKISSTPPSGTWSSMDSPPTVILRTSRESNPTPRVISLVPSSAPGAIE